MIIAQGAEAVIEKVNSNGNHIVLKKRIPKSYRIKEIDKELRKYRTRAEAKNIEKIKDIVNVPKIIKVDEKEGTIFMELIEGKRLSEILEKRDYKKIAQLLGKDISKLHKNNIIHGDLTTSNFILKEKKEKIEIKKINNETKETKEELYFIDFGLSFHSKKEEDKAVDLHVLREALESKHYNIWEEVFNLVLESYKQAYGDSENVLKRLKEVEKRGRNKNKN